MDRRNFLELFSLTAAGLFVPRRSYFDLGARPWFNDRLGEYRIIEVATGRVISLAPQYVSGTVQLKVPTDEPWRIEFRPLRARQGTISLISCQDRVVSVQHD